MIKKLFLCLVVPAALLARSQQMEFMIKLNSGHPHSRNEINKIPVILNGHKICLKAKVNGSEALNFILDTGAITAIDERIAHALNLEKGTALPSLDTLHQAYLSRNKVTISLGDVSVDAFIPIITDLPDAHPPEPSLDGFIGSDFLRFFCLTINYHEQELILSSTRTEPSRPVFRVSMNKFFPLGFPMIDCMINDTLSMKMMIDTGSPFSIVCPLSMIEKGEGFNNQTVLKSHGNFMKWPSTATDYNYLSYAKVLRFGDFIENNVPIFFAELPRQFSSGLIGKDFMDNFITTIDHRNDEILLEPLQNRYQNTLFSTGLGVKKEGERLIVRGVWQNSPADKHGVKVNDEIIQLNEYQTRDLSIEAVSRILNDDKIGEIVLQIKNDQGTRSLTLFKEHLIDFNH